MEKTEVIQKSYICKLRWSENIRFYIFTGENIKYTLYINNIFLYFTTLYIINHTISARLLDIAHLLGCLGMLPLHDVTLDDVRCP